MSDDAGLDDAADLDSEGDSKADDDNDSYFFFRGREGVEGVNSN